MTDCPRGDIRDLLPDLVHDQLAPELRAAVEAHVATCAACAAEVALLHRMRAALGRTPRLDVERIAAAVRAARADDAGVPDTIPIAAIPATRAGEVPAAARPRAARRRVLWSDWRAAAGIAAVAVGVMSYSLARSING
ncbi:MAG: zf-HC2 domain-containing protein, partial [Gemmatimonadaceae bacterium]|nr:zf-HC2 domain-containing protein [Gemmatimonadaceae bacterium]